MTSIAPYNTLQERFRGYYPVVIDVETAGFNAQTDALLEVAASLLEMNDDGILSIKETLHFHVQPFEGSNIEQAAIDFNGIDPFNPLRDAVSEQTALKDLFKAVRRELKLTQCHRAILVAHNATFDKGFMQAAVARNHIKRDPFHPFASFDTATLAGLALGQTVLAKACKSADISFDHDLAHSAAYDTERTAELFCYIVNRWKSLGGWPPEKS